jgi:hypothetical protein
MGAVDASPYLYDSSFGKVICIWKLLNWDWLEEIGLDRTAAEERSAKARSASEAAG